MDIQVTTSPNPAVRTFYSTEVPLSESSQLHYFRAPLPGFLPEEYVRQFRLIRTKGEALVRALCLIPGVSEIFLDEDRVTVIIRENGNLRWAELEPQIAGAFQSVFPETAVRLLSPEAPVAESSPARVITNVGLRETP